MSTPLGHLLDVGGPILGRATTEQVVLGGVRKETEGRRVGSVVKNACSWKGPGFDSQHPHGVFLRHPQACGVQMDVQAKHLYEQNKNLKKKEKEKKKQAAGSSNGRQTDDSIPPWFLILLLLEFLPRVYP